jgi:hypothetical protein
MTLLEDDSTSPRDPDHVGELTLRRFGAGEFSVERSAQIDQHVSACPVCRAKLRRLAEEQRYFQREIPFERFAGGVERARRVPGSRPRSLWSIGFAGVLAAAAVAVFLVGVPTGSHNRSKGTGVDAMARIASAKGSLQRSVPPGSHEILEPGDRIRLGYQAIEARFLAVLSIDEQGEVSPLYPEAGPALPVAATRETVYLPDSIEFTGKGREKVFMFLARNPFDLKAAKQAVADGYRAGHEDLDALPDPAFAGGQQVFSWLFRKP